MTTQALLIATQIAGVPVQTQVPSGGTPPPGSALASSSKAFSEAEKARVAQEAKLLSHKDALMGLANTILRESKALEDDAKRKAALDAIRANFTANRARLRLETPTSS